MQPLCGTEKVVADRFVEVCELNASNAGMGYAKTTLKIGLFNAANVTLTAQVVSDPQETLVGSIPFYCYSVVVARIQEKKKMQIESVYTRLLLFAGQQLSQAGVGAELIRLTIAPRLDVG